MPSLDLVSWKGKKITELKNSRYELNYKKVHTILKFSLNSINEKKIAQLLPVNQRGRSMMIVARKFIACVPNISFLTELDLSLNSWIV